jgi:hypothetical protein
MDVLQLGRKQDAMREKKVCSLNIQQDSQIKNLIQCYLKINLRWLGSSWDKFVLIDTWNIFPNFPRLPVKYHNVP